MSEQNAYDSLLQNDTAQRVRVSMMDAVDKQPDTEAKLQGLAKTYGMPVDAVRLRQPEIERQARLDALDYDTLANRYPKTANALANPNAAAIAHDDVDNMSGLERAARGLFGGAVEGLGMLASGAGVGLNILQRNLTQAAGALLPTPRGGPMTEGALDSLNGSLMGEDWKYVGGLTKRTARQDIMVPEAQRTFTDQVLGGLGQIGVQIPASIFLGPAPLYVQGLDAMDEKVGKDSAPQWKKDLATVGGAAITGITEKWALDHVLGPVAEPVKNALAAALARIGIAAASEGGQEFSENLLQDLLRKGVTNPDAPVQIGDSVQEGAVGATVGGIVRSIIEGALHVRARGARDEQQAQQAEARAQVLGKLAKLAEASKVRERDPAQFAQFMQSVVEEGVPHLYVDANALAKTVDLNKVAMALPSVAEQITQAAQTGGDVVIPTAELMTAGAGHEFMQSLLDNARTSPEAMSPVQAREFMQGGGGDQMKADIDKVLAEREQDQTFQQMRDDLRAEFKAQLDQAKRFTPDVNNQYATLLANFYSATAARLGITPQELATKYGLRVQAKWVEGGQQLDQGLSEDEYIARINPSGKKDEFAEPMPLAAFADLLSGVKTQPQDEAATRDGQRIQVVSGGPVEGALYAIVEGKTVGYMAPEGGTVGLFVAEEFRGRGIGGALSTAYRSREPFAVAGSLSAAGERTARKAFRNLKARGVFNQSTTPGPNGEQRTGADQGIAATSLFDTLGLPNQGRDLIQGKAEELAQALRGQGFKVDLQHSGSVAGPSSYLRVYDPQTGRFLVKDIRLSGHSKGAFNTEGVWNVTDAQFPLVLAAAGKLRDLGPSEMFKAAGDQEAEALRKRLVSADKKLAKGKPLTKSEQEAVDAREKSRNEQTAPDSQGATLNQSTPLPDTIEIDGKQRPTTNSNGQPIAATEEGVRNFWKWFGDSKVVDASGKPLVVYHGTRAQFEVFDFGRIGQQGRAEGAGFYFTTNKQVAAGYGTPMDVYLAVGKPLAYDAKGFSQTVLQKIVKKVAENEAAADGADIADGFLSNFGDTYTNGVQAAVKEAARLISADETAIDQLSGIVGSGVNPEHVNAATTEVTGFDGVVSEGFSNSGDAENRIFVAFRPEQIKSATGNSGEFDPTNPSILRQQARGSITLPEDLTKSPAIISLFKGADLSTFIHESGHFFLEVQADLAARIQGQIDAGASVTDGEREIVADMNKLLAWFGVKGDMGLSALDIWHTMTLEEKRVHHEKFARGFEAYAFEGSAPSVELQGMFQKFRAWLVSVYKELKALNVTLTDDVRGVMDRMLASTEAIQEAEAARRMGPLFKTAEEAGMSLDEFAAYHALATDATQSAVNELQARGLRDMRWLANAKDKKLKELQKEATELRRTVSAEVRAEVMSQPIYQVWQALTAKQDGMRFNTQMLKDAFGQSDAVFWRPLIDKRMTSANTGLHHDVIAERFGFTSGDELIQAILAAAPPASVIEGMTDQRMLERFGDLGTLEGLTKAADRAIHNEARARFVATEIKALETGMRVRAPGATGKSTVDVLATVARQQAEAIVARTKVRDLRPGQYTAAEARAARAAEKAMLAGKTEDALAEKRHQIINLQAAKATMNAQDEMDKTVKYLRKFDGKAVRGNLPADYLNQIDMLLEKFDLSQQSGAAIDRTVALRTWVQSRLAAGEIPAISESLLAPAERRAYEAAINARDDQGNLVYPDDEERIKLLADAIQRSQVRPYQTLTVEEMRGLRDTIKQIEHLGRLKDKLLTARDGRTYAATRDALVSTLVNNAKQSGKNTRTDNTLVGSWLERVKQFGASHIKVATWARIFDGGQDNGAWWSTIIRPANERASFETTRRAEATGRLMDILSPVLKDVGPVEKIGAGKYFPEIGTSLNWEERFTIACNFGNESNLQRLMGGGIAPTRTIADRLTGRVGSPGVKSLTMPQVQAVLRSLSAAEWQAVQGVWDHFETYRPEIAAKELRVNGVEPEWIPARPFTVQTSDGQTLSLRGGYYPVVFDSRTSLKAQQHNDAQAAKDAMKAAYSAATTQRSFTKARVEEVTGRPLLLNLRGLYSGTNDVIHDLAWHEWVIDMNKLMRSQAIDEAIREHYGADVKKELTKWRDDIVAGSKRLDHGIENAAGWARKFTSSAALTYNVMSAVLQPLGITQSFSRVGTTWVAKGIGQYLSGPLEATQMVKEKSEFMRNRTRTMFRDINELRNRVEGQTTGRELMGRYGYYMTAHMQQVVDVPTWIGGYEKAIAAGSDEATAIALADQGVKDSQGGGEEIDQAGITRGGPLVKLFTAFYEFMNTQANVLYLANATSKTKADAFMHFALVGLATPILAAAVKAALTPGDSGDWDEEHVFRTMLREGLANLFGMVAFGREFTGLVDKMLGTNKGVSYSGPSGLRIIPDTIKLGEQAAQGDLDDAFRKSFLNVLGDFSGIPAVQINRTITGAEALSEGETQNPGALVFGYQKP